MIRTVLDPDLPIITVDDVFTPAECQALIAFAEAQTFQDAPITTARGPLMAPGVRNNTRVMIDDPARAAALFERLRDHLPAKTPGWRLHSFNERLRFYRYDPGQRFRWHYDGAFVRSPQERSLITVMVYLNAGFSGGKTRFDRPRGPLAVTPKTGSALLFAHPIRHCGDVIHEGRKYVLRTDAMYAGETPAWQTR